MKKETPILLLTGYLGSGKTTLVNEILANRRGIKFAVIVNDIGEVNIDADLIEKGGVVGKDDDSLVALQNGCICCSLQMDLVKQLDDIMSTGKFDYIVIEASGICEPEPIAQTICSIPRMGSEYQRHGLPRLDAIVSVVDALRLSSEFDCGDRLVENLSEEDIENLIVQQIEFCNIVILNKASEVAPAELGRIRAIIRTLQPKAEIIECDFCKVDLDKLLNTQMFDFDATVTSSTWVQEMDRQMTEEEEVEAHGKHHHHEEGHHHHEGSHAHHDEEEHHHEHHECAHEHHEEHHHDEDHECDHPGCHHHHHHHDHNHGDEYGIETFVYYRRKPFDLNKFDFYVGSRWPRNVIRTKGVVYFSSNTDMSYLFEQAGVQKRLSQAGRWYATAPEEDLAIIREQDPNFMRDWDPEYGDRMIKLVIIGQHLNKEEIIGMLDDSLAD